MFELIIIIQIVRKFQLTHLKEMSLGILGVGLGWTILLYEAFKQYKYCKETYHQKQFKFTLNGTINQQQQKQHIVQDARKAEEMMNYNTQNQEDKNKNSVLIQQNCQESTIFNQDNYIVFPQQYPNLKTKKIKKDIQSQRKNKIRLKKQSKEYKKLFLSNQILFQLCKDQNFVQNQFERVYSQIQNDSEKSRLQKNTNNYSTVQLTQNNNNQKRVGQFNQQPQNIQEDVQSYNVFV